MFPRSKSKVITEAGVIKVSSVEVILAVYFVTWLVFVPQAPQSAKHSDSPEKQKIANLYNPIHAIDGVIIDHIDYL